MDRLLVVGLGGSGRAVAKLMAERAWLVGTDLKSESEFSGVAEEELALFDELYLGGNPLKALWGVDVVVVSPGVPPFNPLLKEARKRGLPIYTEVEFAWIKKGKPKVVAVTGSNGKSTVATMIAEALRASGMRVALGGNIGTPASTLDSGALWVLEISSFQAEALVEMNANVAVFLNISQDHMERHGSMSAYLQAKTKLFQLQDSSGYAVLNRDDPLVSQVATDAARRFFSLKEEADAWVDGGKLVALGKDLIAVDDLMVRGSHNVANALAASLAAMLAGADPEGVSSSLASFRGLPHRHQLVATCGGVSFVDDSKATNVGATVAALSGYPGKSVHLILGGLSKGQDFKPLRKVASDVVDTAYLIGADAAKIEAELSGCVPLLMCGTLDVAVSEAASRATSGQTVLLAPACASFDQFSNFEERGRRFAELVRGLDLCR